MFEHFESPKGKGAVEHPNPETDKQSTKEPYNPEGYRKAKERVEQAELRENFLNNAQNYEQELGSVKVKVAGEEHTLNFKHFNYEGRPAKTTDDLVRNVKNDKKIDMKKIEGSFDLAATRGRAETFKLSLSVPLKKIISGDARVTLGTFITETFAGTDNYYQRLRAPQPKAEAKLAAPGKSEKKERNKTAEEIKKLFADSSKGAGVSILEGEGITSVIVSMPSQEKQLHLTTTGDKTNWNVFQTGKGQKTFEQTNLKPEEVLKFAESAAR